MEISTNKVFKSLVGVVQLLVAKIFPIYGKITTNIKNKLLAIMLLHDDFIQQKNRQVQIVLDRTLLYK